jgi:hypothetical protein
MASQNNNDNNNIDSNNNSDYSNMELYEDFIKESNKRAREEDDEGPEYKRQRENDGSGDDGILSENSSETGSSVSDDGEESETDRINTKYSKRFDAIEDYKEKNELLSEASIQDVMSKLDRGEIISEKEFETLNRANRLMDQDILGDRDSIQRMLLYEEFSASVQKEISDNNARIERHEEKLSEYLVRLDELNKENNDTLSNKSSSGSNDGSDSDSNSDDDNNTGSNNSSNLPGPDNGNDDEFDDFPPSFDFDDF